MAAARRLLHHRSSNTRLPRHPPRPTMTPILTSRYSAPRKRPRSTKGRGEEIAGPASRGRDQPLGFDSLSRPASLLAYICHFFQQNSLIHSIESFLSIPTFVEPTSSFPCLTSLGFHATYRNTSFFSLHIPVYQHNLAELTDMFNQL